LMTHPVSVRRFYLFCLIQILRYLNVISTHHKRNLFRFSGYDSI
jgi:hypothetical protein